MPVIWNGYGLTSEKGFFRRWKDGFRQLTPLQLLVARRWFVVAQFFGLLIVNIVLFMKGLGYWLWFLVPTMGLIGLDWYSVHQQVRQIKKFME